MRNMRSGGYVQRAAEALEEMEEKRMSKYHSIKDTVNPEFQELLKRFEELWGSGEVRTVTREQAAIYFLEGAVAALQHDRDKANSCINKLSHDLNTMH